MVDADGVGAEGLHEGSVTLTLGRVEEGIIWRQLVCNAWKQESGVSNKTWDHQMAKEQQKICSLSPGHRSSYLS